MKCNSSKTVCFLRGIVNLCFEELGHRSHTENFGSLSCMVLSQCNAKKCPYNSISAREFVKVVRKFRVFWTYMIIITKTLQNRKYLIHFDSPYCVLSWNISGTSFEYKMKFCQNIYKIFVLYVFRGRPYYCRSCENETNAVHAPCLFIW